MRANSLIREPEIQKIWDENQVFNRVVDKNSGVSFAVTFILSFDNVMHFLTFSFWAREISFFMMDLHMPMAIFTWAML